MNRKSIRSKLLFLLSMALTAGMLESFAYAPAAEASTQNTFYASPGGTGSICSIEAPCSLNGARDKVRTVNGNMTGDVVVLLLDGMYTLSSTFQLTESSTEHDSGTNGYNVIYQAAPNAKPVISGGLKLSGWQLHDAAKNVYRSYVGTSLDTRQLYVNGVRAIRARGTEFPAGWTKTASGWTAPDSSMAAWGNQGRIEIVGKTEWKMFRCPVSSVNGTSVTMQNPCWSNSQLSGNPTFDSVAWVENAYELLDEAGEWYLDRSSGYLYYKPRAGESMAVAEAIVPVLEELVTVAGTLDSPIRNIRFSGLTFAYATWLQPNGFDGYVPLQAGNVFVGPQAEISDRTSKSLANVRLRAAQNVRLERNTFEHLGGEALRFEYGARNNEIVGNVFRDVSSTGIHIGDVLKSDATETDARAHNQSNVVRSNYLYRTGVEYADTASIFAGYVKNLTVTHNEVSHVPYSGISVGWGWGQDSYARENEISYNLVHDYMQETRDGGGIYTLSSQPDSTITRNYLYNQNNYYGSLYLDAATRYYSVSHNVVRNTPSWLLVQGGDKPSTDNVVQSNYSDTSAYTTISPNNTVTNNQTALTSWPAGAIEIMNQAGIESAYRDILVIPANVAPFKTATATSEYNLNHVAGKANDGDETTGWSPTGNDASPWLQIDLGAPVSISRIRLVTRQDIDYDVTRRNFEIRASNDPSFGTYAVLGSQGGTALPFQGEWSAKVSGEAVYQYVRAVKTVNEYFYVAELKVEGRSAANPTTGAFASASSVYNSVYGAAMATDGSPGTGWSPAGTDSLPWLQVDSGKPTAVSEIRLVSRQDVDQPMTRQNFEIRASNDPGFGTYVVLGSQAGTPFAHQGTWTARVNDSAAYRYIRVAKTTNEYFFVAELRISGGSLLTGSVGTSATASSNYGAGFEASQAIDGSPATLWSPTGSDARPWLQVDLAQPRKLTQIDVSTRQDSVDWYNTRQNFEIRGSNDPTFATYDVLGGQGVVPFAHQGTWTARVTSEAQYRYVRVAKTANEYFVVSELRVYGN